MEIKVKIFCQDYHFTADNKLKQVDISLKAFVELQMRKKYREIFAYEIDDRHQQFEYSLQNCVDEQFRIGSTGYILGPNEYDVEAGWEYVIHEDDANNDNVEIEEW